MRRRGRVALSLLGLVTSLSLIYYFVFSGSKSTNGSCPAERSPYTSFCQDDCDTDIAVCGLNVCEENLRYWSSAFLLAIFAGSLGGADFYLGNSELGYKKLYLGVFNIIGIDLILVLLIVASKLIPAKHRNKQWLKKLYTLMTYVVSVLVGGMIGFLIVLVYLMVMDISSLYLLQKVDVNDCPLI